MSHAMTRQAAVTTLNKHSLQVVYTDLCETHRPIEVDENSYNGAIETLKNKIVG